MYIHRHSVWHQVFFCSCSQVTLGCGQFTLKCDGCHITLLMSTAMQISCISACSVNIFWFTFVYLGSQLLTLLSVQVWFYPPVLITSVCLASPAAAAADKNTPTDKILAQEVGCHKQQLRFKHLPSRVRRAASCLLKPVDQDFNNNNNNNNRETPHCYSQWMWSGDHKGHWRRQLPGSCVESIVSTDVG